LPRMAIGSSCSVLNISQALVLQNDLVSHCPFIKKFSIEKTCLIIRTLIAH